MFFHLQSYYLFLGKSKRSRETKTSKGKLLGPRNSEKGNGIKVSKGTVKVVTSRKGHQVRNPILSFMTGDNV